MSGGRAGSVYWSSVFIKTVLESSFGVAYVFFVATSTVYHADETSGVAVDVVRDESSLLSSTKRGS